MQIYYFITLLKYTSYWFLSKCAHVYFRKSYGRIEVQLHTFLTSGMEFSGLVVDPAARCERNSTPCGPRAKLVLPLAFHPQEHADVARESHNLLVLFYSSPFITGLILLLPLYHSFLIVSFLLSYFVLIFYLIFLPLHLHLLLLAVSASLFPFLFLIYYIFYLSCFLLSDSTSPLHILICFFFSSPSRPTSLRR
jgi:hypothetical protein